MSEFVEINGNRLRYRLRGDGPLAILGHGLLGSIEQLDEHQGALARLEARLRLLVYDARGHGQSEGPEDVAGYSWESLGLDTAALIRHFGEERAIVGGGSMGAASALWLAIERPELVRALVLVMPPPLGPPEIRGEDERKAIALLEALAAAVQNFGMETTANLARNMPGLNGSPEAAEERARWLLKINPLAIRYAIPGLLGAPIHDPECYRQIRVPTLVLAHEGDALHPARAARLVGDKVPDCTVRIAPDDTWWERHPEELLAEAQAFLDRVG